MTAWNPLDNCYSLRSYPGTSQASYYYYPCPSHAFQSTTSCEQWSVTPPKRKQSKRALNVSLHSHHRSDLAHDITPPSCELSISIDDLRAKSRYRFRLRTGKRDRHSHAQRSTHTLPPGSQSNENATDDHRVQHSTSITNYYRVLKQQSKTITNDELISVLNKLTGEMKDFNSNSQKQQLQHLPILTDIVNALLDVNSTMLTAVSQNNFFTILQTSLINILHQWRQRGFLTEDQSSTLHSTTKLLNVLTENSSLIPPWLSDSTLLDTIATCLTDIATQGKFLDITNTQHFRHFTHLIATYILYQQRLSQHNHSNKDTFIQLLHPIQQCLASEHFIRAFDNLVSHPTSLTTSDKFFLLKCPAFLTSYNGSALEETMHTLLSTMLPKYVAVLGRVLVSSPQQWSESTMRCVETLLSMIAHGADQFAENRKIIGEHVAVVDHLLQLVDEPALCSKVRASTPTVETMVMRSAMRLLVKLMGEPSVLSHLKERHAASIFLRLTTCADEVVVLDAYTLLAFTTDEEEMQAMQNFDQLLPTFIQSLRLSLVDQSRESGRTDQLLEILKGLVQHDQIKQEISKHNVLPYLLELTDTLTGRSLVLLYEILWSLTFYEETARALRANTHFLEKIEAISKGDSDSSLKRAVSGLVWTLLEEPAHLRRAAKYEAGMKHKYRTRDTTAGLDGETDVVGTTSEEDNATASESGYRHDIMISYCHADKELTYRIYKFLVNQGFKVWIDLDNMHGPAMSAMADAVENSEFVILCMSDAYKRSTYCQSEAEYAFNCKRKLIPLIMRPGYRPDGWLGFIIGSRIYIDFGRFDFDTACGKLMTEISLHRKQPVSNVLDNLVEYAKPAETVSNISKRPSKTKKSSSKRSSIQSTVDNHDPSSVIHTAPTNLDHRHKHIEQWTPSDVVNFLLSHQLDQILPLCENLNGRALIQLHEICAMHRLQAYSIIKSELKYARRGRISMNIYSRFLTVIEDVMKFPQAPQQVAQPAPVPALPPTGYPIVMPPIAFIPAPDLNRSYDFLITSDAPPLDTLRMVEQYSSQLEIIDYLRHAIANVY